MHRRSAIGELMLAVTAAMGVCVMGCRPSGEPPAPVPPAGVDSQTSPESQAGPGPAIDEPSAQIGLALTAPEEVAVGEDFILEIAIDNRGPEAARDLLAEVRFDSALEQTDSAGDVHREVGELGPGQSRRFGIKLRATRPGTFSQTAEVRRDEDVLASQWTTVTATGPEEAMAEAEPPSGPSEETGPPPGPDLGPPLVADPDALQKLHPFYPVWFDKATKSVVMVGAVCQRRAPLELFACLRGSKEHESVVAVATEAYVVHAGLLATGAEPGAPVQFVPEYAPPRGPEIEVQVIWKDEQGQKHQARAQDWVRNMQTGKAMSAPWVFGGSRFVNDETTGERFYVADVEGDLICVANFSGAVLDIPVESTDSDAGLLFDAFTERIPPRGTPVTLVLTPKLDDEIGEPESETEEP